MGQITTRRDLAVGAFEKFALVFFLLYNPKRLIPYFFLFLTFLTFLTEKRDTFTRKKISFEAGHLGHFCSSEPRYLSWNIMERFENLCPIDASFKLCKQLCRNEMAIG